MPGAVIKNTCLIVCRLLRLQFWLFTASFTGPEGSSGSCHEDVSMGAKRPSPLLISRFRAMQMSGFSFQDMQNVGYLTLSLGVPPGLQAALQKQTAFP